MSDPLLPSDFLILLLAQFKVSGPSAAKDQRLLRLGSDLHDRRQFREDLTTFLGTVLKSMGSLPDKTQREVLLRKRVIDQFRTTKEAFDTAKALLEIAASAARLRGQPDASLGGYLNYYFDGKDNFRVYTTLRHWLWRQSQNGAKKVREYRARPEVKERIYINRPSKEEEADRQRVRYWQKKGLSVPPPRRPKTNTYGEDAVLNKNVIYFIQCNVEPHYVKIGLSTKEIRRVKDITQQSPVPVTFLGMMSGSRKIEAALHVRFGAHRMKGEWFAPHEELLSFIRGLVNFSAQKSTALEEDPAPSVLLQ
jgi:DNA-binding transcriptional MerR regulator